jgi:D-alanyl-D-alanine endopeptidase (penicillin-binding protein 7)
MRLVTLGFLLAFSLGSAALRAEQPTSVTSPDPVAATGSQKPAPAARPQTKPKASTTAAPKTKTTAAHKTKTTAAPKTSTTAAHKTSTTAAHKTKTTAAPKTKTTAAHKTKTTAAARKVVSKTKPTATAKAVAQKGAPKPRPKAVRKTNPPQPSAAPVTRPLLAAGAIDPRALGMQSVSLLVLDQADGKVLMARNPDDQTSIASITKLMTAMVTLDAQLPMQETITIDEADVDRLKGTHSRLVVGSRLPRHDILRLALMSSENRAAASLARTYPGGRAVFINAMNAKAKALGMQHSHFADPAGLNPRNLSTASDLALMVRAASDYLLIREFTTTTGQTVSLLGGRRQEIFKNTNRLVQTQSPEWHIELSKTGYTSEAGRCLVMKARVAERTLILVLLDGAGKLTPIGDANRVRRWLESRRPTRSLAAH